jgi:hypothetical protein
MKPHDSAASRDDSKSCEAGAPDNDDAVPCVKQKLLSALRPAVLDLERITSEAEYASSRARSCLEELELEYEDECDQLSKFG